MRSWHRVLSATLLLLASGAGLVWLHTPSHREPSPQAHKVSSAAPGPPASPPAPDVVAATDEALRLWSSVAKDQPGFVVCDGSALADGPGLTTSEHSPLRALDLREGVLSAGTTTPFGSAWVTDVAGHTFRVTWSEVAPGERGRCAVTPWDGAEPTVGPDWRSTTDDPTHFDPGSREDLRAAEEASARRLASDRAELARHEELTSTLSGPARERMDRAVAVERAEVEVEAAGAEAQQREMTFYKVMQPVIQRVHGMLGVGAPRREPAE